MLLVKNQHSSPTFAHFVRLEVGVFCRDCDKSQEMSNLGLKVGDIIKYTATLKKRISGYIGTNIYCRYKSPKKEFYKFMNPTAVSKEGGHKCS